MMKIISYLFLSKVCVIPRVINPRDYTVNDQISNWSILREFDMEQIFFDNKQEYEEMTHRKLM